MPVVSAVREVGRNLVGLEICLDPRVGVQLANLVVTARGIPLVALEADHHPRRNPLAAEHERQGGGEILAMPLGMFADEIFDWIEFGIAVLAGQAVLELPGCGKLPLQVARPAERDLPRAGRTARSNAWPA